MKVLIPILIDLLVVGCEKKDGHVHHHDDDPKELTLEDKVIGTYEYKRGDKPFRIVLLDNGISEQYRDGISLLKTTWSIVDKEVHIYTWPIGMKGYLNAGVFRSNPDNSITLIAGISRDGKREETPKEEQRTYKNIK
jgi:hypothetical protein